MANNFSTATLGLGVDTKDFYKDIGDIQQHTEKALNNMKLSADAFSEKWGSLTAGIKDTKRIVSGILVSQGFYALSNALLEAGAAALSFSMNMETAAISMEYFVKGADKIAKSQAFLRTMNEFAARTPFSTEEAISLSKYMQAMGVSMNTTKSFLKVITDTAAATGATEQNLQRIVFGLGQMMTKGRLANEEIRQLANANIPIYDILKEQLNLTGAQISNIGRYWVDADKAVVAILRGLEDRYGGAADRIAETVTGMTDTIFDNAKIIAQIASSGVYESLADKMSIVRDALDRYREIAVERGSAGLFDQILRDLDASGKLGTEILALIGNTKQLGSALRDLYVSGKPLLNLFGKSLYTSISVAQITLTAMARTADVVVAALNEMGLTTGNTAEVLSSLFIAYHAAKWMGTLGMAARAAGYNAFQAAQQIYTIIPASLQASASAKVATASLLGLAAAGLAALGMFSAINNIMAGLDSKTSAGNLFPDDYEQAMDKYNAAMEEYNARIAALEDDYNAPFTEIEDGTMSAVDGLKDVEKASSKAAKSVKNDWLAAFDEVYAIPKDRADDLSGLDALLGDKVDFGASLIPPAFKFPKIDGIKLEMPKLEDFLSGSILDPDSEVLDSSWWKSFLPIALTGAAMSLGKVLAGNTGAPGDSGGTGGKNGGSVNPFQPEKEAAATLKDMSKKFTGIEEKLNDTLKTIKDGKYKTPDEVSAAYKRLQMQTEEAAKLQERISQQAIVAGRAETLSSNVILEAQQKLLARSIVNNAEAFNALQSTAKDLGFSGDKARREVQTLRRTIEKQYADYITLGGATASVDPAVEGIIHTKGLAGKIEVLNTNVGNIRKLLSSNEYNAASIKDMIDATSKVGKEVTKVLDSIGSSDTVLAENLGMLDKIEKLLADQSKAIELNEELKTLTALTETRAAQDVLGNKINLSAINDAVESINKRLENIREAVDVNKAVIGAGTPTDIVKARETQALINSTNAFRQFMHTFNTYIDGALNPLKAIEIYNKRLILDNADGQKIIKNGILNASTIMEKAPAKAAEALEPLFDKLESAYRQSIKTGTAPSLTFSDSSKELLEAVNKIGVSYKANSDVVSAELGKLNTKIATLTGKYPEIEEVLNKIATNVAKQAQRVPVGAPKDAMRTFVEVFEDKLEQIANTAKTINEFEKLATDQLKVIKKLAEKETDARYESYVKKLQLEGRTPLPKDKFPIHYAQIEEDLLDEFREALEDFNDRLTVDKLPKSQADLLLTSHKTKDPVFNQIRALARELAAFTDNYVGAGIRSNKAYLPEKTGGSFESNIEAGYLDSLIAKSGLFKPFQTALKASDIAALGGQSSYGKTTFTVIADRLNDLVRLQEGIPLQLDTLRTLTNKVVGQLMTVPTLKQVNEILRNQDYMVSTGGTFYAHDRRLAAQVNGVVYNKQGKFTNPIDTKTMANFESRLLPILEKYGASSDGIYAISEAGFKALQSSFDEIAWELAGQAAVMGTDTVYLAVADKVAAGLDKLDFSKFNWANIADPKVAKAISEEMSQTVAHYIVDNQDKIAESVKLIAVKVPQDAIREAILRANQFKDALSFVAGMNKLGSSISDLLTPINTLGEKIGSITAQRYDGSIYDAPTLGNGVANQFISELVTDLKSINKEISSAAAARLTDVIEKMNKGVFQKGISPYDTRTVEIGETMLGNVARITLTGEDMLSKVQDLQKLLSSIDSRASAITTSLNDLVNKYNTGAAQGLRMEDLSGFSSAKGTPLTMRDLAYAIVNQERQISDSGNLNRQLQASLGTASSNNPAIPITNYAQVADVGTLINSFSSGLASGIAQLGGSGALDVLLNPADDKGLSLGNSVYSVNANADAAAAFWKKVEETWTKVQAPAYTAHGEAARAYNAANALTDTQKAEALLENFYKFVDKIDDTKLYVSDMGTQSGKVLKAAASKASVKNTGGLASSKVYDTAGNLLYEPYMASSTASPFQAYTGDVYSAYSPGWSPKVAKGSFRAGRYVDMSTEAVGAAHNPEFTNTAKGGIYAEVNGKRVKVSSAAIGNAIGILSIAATVGAYVSSSKNAAKEFNTSVLPMLSEADKAGASERAKNMNLSGWTEGALAQASVDAFFRQYSEMTKEERVYWGRNLAGSAEKNQYGYLPDRFDAYKEILTGASAATGIDKVMDTSMMDSTSISKLAKNDDKAKQLLEEALKAGIDSSDLAKIIDYIVLSGDTESDMAKDFYKVYGKFMDSTIKPAYGMDAQWNTAAQTIISQATGELRGVLEAQGISQDMSASDIPVNMFGFFDQIIGSVQDSLEAQILPVLQAREEHNEGTTPLTGDYARVVTGLDMSSLSGTAEAALKEILGISFESLGENMSKISIDSDEINDNIIGWTKRLPDNISLDGTTLSAQDIEILASAGIQVNGDGTVTFMKAMNENVTGTDRSLGLTISDVSGAVMSKLKEAGLSFEFGDAETELNLSVEKISEKMQSAMFRLNKDFSGQISDDMRDALSGIGEVLDSGYLNITDEAILSGQMSVREYLEGMGYEFDRGGNYIYSETDELSGELVESLLAIDDVIAQGGEATKQTIAEWADGVVMPSPIDEAKLTDEMRLAFEAIGITFTGSGEEFKMVINKLSNDLKDGMVLIPAETWNRIDDEIVTALEELGVSITPTAAGIMVDLAGTMDNGVGSIIELFANRPDLWDQIPEQFKETFAAAGFSVEDGMIKINMAALDGMVALGTEWYTKWSDLPQDVIDALGLALYQTEDGLLKLEQVTADTAIPESIEEGIIKPFSELPKELQDKLTGGDASVVKELENAQFKITGATEDAFVGAVNAVSTSFSTMNNEAADGAAQLAKTIADAMAQTATLSNVKIKKSYNPFANRNKPTIKGSPGNYSIVYGGQEYSNIRATDKEAARRIVEDIRGEKIPGFKFGGIVDTDGLYRAGEFGRKEGIIPLENKQGLQVIGNTILNSLAGSSSPVQRSLLSSMVGNSTGGAVVNSAADNMHAYYMTQKNIQASSQQQQAASNKPVVYVQTMIADKQGLRELEKKLEIVRLERS